MSKINPTQKPMDSQTRASPSFRVNKRKEPKFTVKRPPCECQDCTGRRGPPRDINKLPKKRARLNDSVCETPEKKKRKTTKARPKLTNKQAAKLTAKEMPKKTRRRRAARDDKD